MMNARLSGMMLTKMQIVRFSSNCTLTPSNVFIFARESILLGDIS